MAESLKFTCATCGEVHVGLPDRVYDAPHYYYDVPEHERDQRCRLSEDLCTVDQEYFFVRCVLLVPIEGTAERFGWGVWSSLSETNFKRYVELFDERDVTGEGPYFGWLSNRLPFYPDTLDLKVQVNLQNDGQRPLLELEPTDHPLAVDQRDGMSWERAVDMAQQFMHPDDAAASH